jgi:phosphoribosylanthranilate isomerase
MDNEKLKKFINDPDWKEVEKMILNYIEPLRDVLSVDANQTAEEIKAEIKARQRSYVQLKGFLSDAQILSGSEELEKPLSFK